MSLSRYNLKTESDSQGPSEHPHAPSNILERPEFYKAISLEANAPLVIAATCDGRGSIKRCRTYVRVRKWVRFARVNDLQTTSLEMACIYDALVLKA